MVAHLDDEIVEITLDDRAKLSCQRSTARDKHMVCTPSNDFPQFGGGDTQLMMGLGITILSASATKLELRITKAGITEFYRAYSPIPYQSGARPDSPECRSALIQLNSKDG